LVRSHALPSSLQGSERVNVFVSPRNRRTRVPGAGFCMMRSELFMANQGSFMHSQTGILIHP